MKPICLASSSAGNCFIFEFMVEGVPTQIMVECGIPKKTLYTRMNQERLELCNIKACLITHAHKDHCVAAQDLHYLGIPIFATVETLNAIGITGTQLKNLTPTTVCEGIKVMAFEVEHDCPGSVGFVIKTKDECVIFVNDHKRWNCNLINFKPDYVFIECNYYHKVVYAQLNELRKKIKNCPLSHEEYEEARLKIAQHERNLNSHCSLHGTLCGLRRLNLKNTKCIFLMHLSDRYANEYKMKNEIQLETQILTKVCQKMGGIK